MITIVAAAACERGSKPTSTARCSKISERGRGESGTVARAYAITAEQCARDKWSAEVVDCLLVAKNGEDEDACFNKLTPEQEAHLTAAMTALADADDTARNRATYLELANELATNAEGPFRDAPECVEYRRILTNVFSVAIACSSLDVMAVFGAQKFQIGNVRRMRQAPGSDVAAECQKETKRLLADPSLRCAP